MVGVKVSTNVGDEEDTVVVSSIDRDVVGMEVSATDKDEVEGVRVSSRSLVDSTVVGVEVSTTEVDGVDIDGVSSTELAESGGVGVKVAVTGDDGVENSEVCISLVGSTVIVIDVSATEGDGVEIVGVSSTSLVGSDMVGIKVSITDREGVDIDGVSSKELVARDVDGVEVSVTARDSVEVDGVTLVDSVRSSEVATIANSDVDIAKVDGVPSETVTKILVGEGAIVLEVTSIDCSDLDEVTNADEETNADEVIELCEGGGSGGGGGRRGIVALGEGEVVMNISVAVVNTAEGSGVAETVVGVTTMDREDVKTKNIDDVSILKEEAESTITDVMSTTIVDVS